MQTLALTPILGLMAAAIIAAMIGSLYLMEAVEKAARKFWGILRNWG